MEVSMVPMLFFSQLVEVVAGAGMLALGLVLMAVYMLPFVVAFMRGHPATLGIFLVNLFLGWSVIGWIVAFVWALSATTTEIRVVQ